MGPGQGPCGVLRVRLWGRGCGHCVGGREEDTGTAGRGRAGDMGTGAPSTTGLSLQMMVWEAGAVSGRRPSSSLLWEKIKQSG